MAIGVAERALSAAEFVLSEIERISRQTVAEQLAASRDSEIPISLYNLGANGDGEIIVCGQVAWSRFNEVVEFARSRDPVVSQNASTGLLRRAVTRRFIDRFVTKKNLPTISRLTSALDAACKDVKGKLETFVLAIPCVMWSQGSQDPVTIGPVTFFRSAQFFAAKELKLGRGSETSQQTAASAKDFALKAGWIAVVEIPNVDLEIAESRACQAVDSALNVFRLALSPKKTRRCRRASTPGPPGFHSYLRVNSDLILDAVSTWDGAEDLMWENWAEVLVHNDRTKVVEWCGRAIFCLTDPGESFPLQHRFVDALKWYGDAVTESNQAARIAKCVFAWERLVVTSKDASGQNITSTVSIRASMLCELTSGARGRDLTKQVERLYDIRSQLAHGSKSPWDESEIEEHSHVAEEITRRVLFGGLCFYVSLKSGGASDAELELAFQKASAAAVSSKTS